MFVSFIEEKEKKRVSEVNARESRMKRDRLPEKYATLRVITSNKNTTKQFKNEMNPMYKVGMLVRIRLRGVWRKAKIVDRTKRNTGRLQKRSCVFSEEDHLSARKEKKK